MHEVYLLWVWSGWGAPIITYNMTQVPKESATYQYQVGIHSYDFQPQLYVYKVDLLWVWSGWEVLIITYIWPKWETKRIYCQSDVRPSMSVSGWGCIHMTVGNSRRCWNTIYMYKKYLPWVWIGWHASIITYSMMQVRTQVNLLLPPHHCEWDQCGATSQSTRC